jgi:hypothetical protein
MSLSMLPRLILGGATGLLLFSWLNFAALVPEMRFAFVVPVRASQATIAQLYFDRGAGFVEADSSSASVLAGNDGLTEVRLPLPWGRFRAFRFDPGRVASEYAIGRARIEDADGRTVASFGTGAFDVLGGARVAERTVNTVVVVATDADPQLAAVFATPLNLFPGWPTLMLLVLIGAGLIALATAAFTWLDQTAARPWSRAPAVGARHKALIVSAAALFATLAATYPLLAGRSLVSPNVGPTVMFYDRPPLLPGSSDTVVEDARGGDTGSMMWGIMPYSRVQREAIRDGEWPFWQRYSGLGRPLWGQGQSLFLDPIHLVSLIIPDVAVGWDFEFICARLVFAVGTGLAVLAVTGSPIAGSMAGAFAPFIGYFTYRLNHPASFSLTYTPWLLWAFAHIVRQRLRRGALAWGAAAAVMTGLHIVSSTPKEGAIALLGCYIAGGTAVVFAAGTRSERLARIAGVGAAGLVGVLLAAPHWLVFLDTLSRAWTVYDVPAARLATLGDLSPLLLGAVAPVPLGPGVNMLIIVGALMSIFSRPETSAPRAVLAGCWTAIVSCLAVAFGAVPTPWLLSLPLIGNLYSVNTSFFGAALPPLLLAAGIGFAELPALMAQPRRQVAWSVLFVATSVAVVRWHSVATPFADPRGAWVLATLGAALLFPWIAASWLNGEAHWSGPATTVLLAAVVLAPDGLHLGTGNSRLDAVLMQPGMRPQLTAPSPAIAAARTTSPDPFRAIGLGYVLFPGTQALWDFEGIIGADAIEGPWLRELGTAGGMFGHPWIWLSLFDEHDLTSKAGLLDLFGVRIVFADPGHLSRPWRELPLAAPDRVRVIERPSAWPRAFFANALQVYDQPDDLIQMLGRTRQPFAAIQSVDAQASELASQLIGEPGETVPATHYRLTANTTTFDVTANGPGVAVVTEAYDSRDFLATLNGSPVPYFRVDHALKAITIPAAGTWTVRFEYRPALWPRSWAVAGVGWLLVFALVAQRRI